MTPVPQRKSFLALVQWEKLCQVVPNLGHLSQVLSLLLFDLWSVRIFSTQCHSCVCQLNANDLLILVKSQVDLQAVLDVVVRHRPDQFSRHGQWASSLLSNVCRPFRWYFSPSGCSAQMFGVVLTTDLNWRVHVVNLSAIETFLMDHCATAMVLSSEHDSPCAHHSVARASYGRILMARTSMKLSRPLRFLRSSAARRTRRGGDAVLTLALGLSAASPHCVHVLQRTPKSFQPDFLNAFVGQSVADKLSEPTSIALREGICNI